MSYKYWPGLDQVLVKTYLLIPDQQMATLSISIWSGMDLNLIRILLETDRFLSHGISLFAKPYWQKKKDTSFVYSRADTYCWGYEIQLAKITHCGLFLE